MGLDVKIIGGTAGRGGSVLVKNDVISIPKPVRNPGYSIPRPAPTNWSILEKYSIHLVLQNEKKWIRYFHNSYLTSLVLFAIILNILVK